jgi:hypothetical protein
MDILISDILESRPLSIHQHKLYKEKSVMFQGFEKTFSSIWSWSENCNDKEFEEVVKFMKNYIPRLDSKMGQLLNLLKKENPIETIRVKICSENFVELPIDKNKTVAEFLDDLNLEVQHYQVVYKGRLMNHSKTFFDFDIKYGDNIFIIGMLRGGGVANVKIFINISFIY